MKNVVSIKWDISWKLNSISKASPLHLQLVDLISKEFQDGNYPDDFKMPPVRLLAAFLKIKIHYVGRAYAHLIQLNEVLYKNGRRGTFMLEREEKDVANTEIKVSGLIFQPRPIFSFSNDTSAEINMITLGNTYPWDPVKIMQRIIDKYVLKDNERLLAPGEYYFAKALRMLKMRRIINNDQQLCIVPDGKALFKVLKNLVNPGAKIVCVSSDDRSVMDVFYHLHLDPVFTGADEEGMSMDRLEIHCKDFAVDAVFLRISPDYPKPYCLTMERWEQLIRLSELYNFWILVMDDEYEFTRLKQVKRSTLLSCSHVIYISALSKISQIFHQIGLIAGPVVFITFLKQAVERCFVSWNSLFERSMVAVLGQQDVDKKIYKINNKCKNGTYFLKQLFHCYLEKHAELLLPGAGTFGLLSFDKAIDPRYLLPLLKTKGYHSEENTFFEVTKPVNALRISLCTEEWKTLETVFRNIRGQPAESRVFA